MTTPKEPTMPNNEELIALAERCARLDRRIRGVTVNDADLSASGQAIAIAMLVTLEAGLLSDAAAALRARAAA